MTSRTYGISPRRRNVLIATWLILTLPLAVAGLVGPEPALLAAAGLISAILLPIFALAIRGARLRLSDDGVDLRQLGLRISTPWDNVAGVSMVRGREGLVLHRPVSGKGAERLAASASMTYRGASMYDADQGELIAGHRFIPIEAFAYWLEHGDLREVLTARVPSLAAPDAFTPPPPEKLPRRRVVMIVAIIVASAAAGLGLAVAPAEIQVQAERILAIPIALAIGVYGIVNGAAAVRYLRRGNFGWFALWAAAAIVQMLIVLAILGEIAAG